MVNLYFTSLESEPKNCDEKILVNADFLPENPALIMLMALGSYQYGNPGMINSWHDAVI